METLTRRGFMGGAAAASAAIVLGVRARSAVRRYGPVEIRTYLFSKEPVAVKGALFADEARGVFGIQAFDESGAQMALAEMPLERVRSTVARAPADSDLPVLFVDEHGKEHRRQFPVTVRRGNLTFFMNEPGQALDPAWLRLSDIRRVL